MKHGNFRRILMLGFLIIPLYFSFSLNIYACSCSPENYAPACQRLSNSSVVFWGEPVEFKGGVYRFRIKKVYKGIEPTSNEVMVYGLAGTSCEMPYSIGVSYIVFAAKSSQPNAPLITSLCSGSRTANEDDLNFLEDFIEGKSATTVYGQVLQWVTRIGLPEPDESNPIEGASLLLENADQKYKAVSDPKGIFSFAGVPAGEYNLSARLDPFSPDPSFYKVSVINGGCAQVFVQLKPMSSIEGTLLYPSGKPAANKRVELLRKNQSGEWYSTYYMWKQTDDDGKFKFNELETGEYLLGYEIWGNFPSADSPYPTFYFPGVGEWQMAQSLTLTPGRTVTGLKLKLPPKQSERKITIRVFFADGKPLGKITPPDSSLLFFNRRRMLFGDKLVKDGVYTLTGYQEREYEISANYWNRESMTSLKSEAVTIKPGKEDAEIVLILKENN
jgi:hypothetical protein